MQIVCKPGFVDEDADLYEDTVEGIMEHLGVGRNGLEKVYNAIIDSDLPSDAENRMADFINKVSKEIQVVIDWLDDNDPSVDFNGNPIK